MRNVEIQKAKLKRIIDLQGVEYTFYRDNKDELGEPTGESADVATIKGLWHESQGYVSLVSGDASTVRSKPQAQILTLYEMKGDISQGDYLMIDGTRYNVTGVHDPTLLGIAADISLEVVV